MSARSSSPDLPRAEQAFEVLWSGRLARLVTAMAVVFGAAAMWDARWPLVVGAGVVLFCASHLWLGFMGSRSPRTWPMRIAVAALAAGLVGVGTGASVRCWLTLLPMVVVAAFARCRWQAAAYHLTAVLTMGLVASAMGMDADYVLQPMLGLTAFSAIFHTVISSLRVAVTRAQEREEELARVNDQLEVALSARKAFLATMSHEIRTPMNGVLGMAELLGGTELSEEQREMVDIIRGSGMGLLQVLNDILDLSKLDAGRMEAEHVPYRPRAVIQDVVQLMRHSDLAPGVQLEARLDIAPARVCGDPSRLRQVLLNLVGNAVKFTGQGCITVHGVWRDDRLHISVVDTGPGIPPDHLERLFEPFVQADSTTSRRFGGTGLGLAISRRLVRVLGGELTVESTDGKGSTFRFDIPAPPETSPPSADAAPLALPSGSTRFDLDVLLVDDNPVNLAVAEAMLSRLGCRVTSVASGPAAVKAADARPFDLVFMDVQMPGMDGFEAMEKLRAAGHEMPVIALTAGVTMEERDAVAASGMHGVVAKPATLRRLREVLARWAITESPDDKPE